MNKMARGFAYLLAANFEALAVFFGSWMVAKWLDENYPQPFRWILVTLPVGLLVIAHAFYVLLRALMRLEKQSSSSAGVDKAQNSSFRGGKK
jgi:hypothetical protein